MDALEQLLQDTLADAARCAPEPREVQGTSRRFRRPSISLAVLSAAATVALILGVLSLFAGSSSKGNLTSAASAQSATTTTGRRVGGFLAAGGTMASRLVYPLDGEVYLSRDRRTLYSAVPTSQSPQTAPCWADVEGRAYIRPDGLAEVLLESTDARQGASGPSCFQLAGSGPKFVALKLQRAYDKPYVLDLVSGARHRIAGVITPGAGQVLNTP